MGFQNYLMNDYKVIEIIAGKMEKKYLKSTEVLRKSLKCTDVYTLVLPCKKGLDNTRIHSTIPLVMGVRMSLHIFSLGKTHCMPISEKRQILSFSCENSFGLTDIVKGIGDPHSLKITLLRNGSSDWKK